ncbi:MAG: TspO/MBR family protein [Pseudomonadota bacterium]
MDWMLFMVFFGACAAAASTGAMFPPDAWYRTLTKPAWTPPDWVFPVTWTVLYVLIAFAATRVAALPGAELALAFWALQMTLNTLWSPIFFGLRRIRAALVAVGALWAAVFGAMVTLFRLDVIAGAMFVPYLVWVSIAAALNFWIWRNNEDIYAQQSEA